MNRRHLLGYAGASALGIVASRARGVSGKTPPMTASFPQKGELILRRERPPLLETPLSVFQADMFTPNDRFFVRWHWGDIPNAIDVATFRLRVGGHVARRLAIPLAALLRMPRVELVAVNQCSGNSRSFFQPPVPGAQWGHGAMGNARWTGVRLKDVLDLAGVRGGATAVRFGGLDRPLVAGAPDFLKSLTLDRARDGEVMIAFEMNGEQLPLLNGFPIRLVVPGWYSTYWVKMLDSIEVLAGADENYWMAKAYRVPTTHHADVVPGAKDFPTQPIGRMVPRAWITSLPSDVPVAFEPWLPVGGIALGGDRGVARVELSTDGGRSWTRAALGPDLGRYSFRRFDGRVPVARRGALDVLARCTNTAGETQPLRPNWNPSGYMRGCVEVTRVMLG